jgi:UDP-N-acetylglucosamine--N-acetylmuramyl-(pentapeptide) pyrophosphoryl-undecaprenol N-acetylglucosamine transferase
MTGLPVRAEFFTLPVKAPSGTITVLLTGGSRGSRRLNEAGKASWPLFKRAKFPIRWIHQTGATDYAEISAAFQASGSEGQVVPFLENMPQAFAQSDLIVCRSGAGAVSEIAAAGKPSILIPFPFAADQHQLRNAESMSKAGAARLMLDQECTGQELFNTIQQMATEEGLLERMGRVARQFAKPDAAKRAAEILEEEAIRSAGWNQG